MRDANEQFHVAQRLHQSGDSDRAVALLQEITADDPDHGRAWELLGLISWRPGRQDRTRRCLETASMLVPLRPEALCGLAECYAAERRAELALLLFRRVLDDERSCPDILLTAAAGADALNAPGLSLRACRRALRIDPDSAQAHYDLGYYLGRVGSPMSRIEAAARKAIQLAPEQLQYRLGLASFLHKHSRSAAAYDVVRTLTETQLEEVGCACCLERMADLYKTAGDSRRSEWCRTRLHALQAARAGASHHRERGRNP